ncbi:DUF2806 domain-containing protein [Halomonas saccharevitans]|uniref:DUF2806 domain-containing protein n=1 Tax=Halomonas saccharevitans TaxID=416872 RepID=A0ABU3NEP3_9GAMM|nr:DUF2806 domain-containing protein [Halomonas saccharevitans]MDT8878636.1 DUF2806 domain-containing protein [Halomonas saccharevitans]
MNIEVSDMFGLSQPITKLIEVTSRGLGRSTDAFFRVRNAKAFAKELEVVSGALENHGKALGGVKFSREDIEVLSSETGLPSESVEQYTALAQRAYSAGVASSMRKQANTESVLSAAAEELKEEEYVPEEDVDEDWLSLYFSIIENVSSDYMKLLWGKVLAGQIKSPDRFSLRTLDVLRTMSAREAELFSQVARHAVTDNGKEPSHILLPQDELLEFHDDMAFGDYNLLEQIGLVQGLSLTFSNLRSGARIILRNGGKAGRIDFKEEVYKISINYTAFTRIGLDLFSLVQERGGSEQYLEKVLGLFDVKTPHQKVVSDLAYREGKLFMVNEKTLT